MAMNSREARNHDVCRLSTALFRDLIGKDIQMPGDWLMQVGKSVLSIGSNWVEAQGKRGTPKATAAAWRHARGSAYEAAYQFEAAGMIAERDTCDRISDMIDEAIASESSSDVEESSVGEPSTPVGAEPGIEVVRSSQGTQGLNPVPHADGKVFRGTDASLRE
jgi:hypothetical protein